VDKDGHVALADFAATLPEEREQLTRNKGNGLWMNQLCHRTLLQKFKGFKAHPEL
jgi:cytochrome c oxidase subunit 3